MQFAVVIAVNLYGKNTPALKHCLRYSFYLLLVFLFFSCRSDIPEKKYVIGFSQCTGFDDWRKTMLAEMKRELSFHDNLELLYRDANGRSDSQIIQIEELAKNPIDLLIVSPNEIKPLTTIIEKVYNSGIPVVVVDRRIDSKNYTSFIGASNFEVGQNAGRYAATILKGKGNIIEVTGIPDASPVIDRHKGFMDIISGYPDLKYIKRFDNYTTSTPGIVNPVETFLKMNSAIDLVYAQNDFMAFDVYKICEKLGLEKKIRIIGIDGLPSKGGGLEMVQNKYIDATVLYPTGGQEAIATAAAILQQQPFLKENQLFTTVIDSTNIRITKLQNEKLLAQQRDIDRSQKKIEDQAIITKNQSYIIYTISISLALALIMGFVLFFFLKENKKINARLAMQNQEIIDQRNQLIELGKKAKEATDAKFNFFTNISHELRTPLTLILGPIEEMLQSSRQTAAKAQLEMVKKNTLRLLRLVNQLMDFRKIEQAKMKLRATENDLISFVSEITNAFTETAKKKNILFRIDSKEKELKVWFDVNMVDKILFNLLSNAFKFTNEHGSITVKITKDETNSIAIITVEDSGIGMSPETLEHAFDLFYQGNEGTYKGTGLGLALSKELIILHHGDIKIRSEKWKGTTFEVQLPLGNKHLEIHEIVKEAAPSQLNYEDAKIYTSETEPVKKVQTETLTTHPKEQSILLIEDNTEIRQFLKDHLSADYEILEAENGSTGLNMAYEIIPDVIISDIMLPGKDGMFITDKLKNDIRTSHIPIIILTAKGSIEQQIEGLRLKADAYIIKPFNMEYVKETIRNLIRNREILKEHYSSELPSESIKASASKKIDRKFVREFSSIVESNVANENFSVDDICKEIGISRVQLYKKVKAVLGYNVNDYILSVRMQKAKYMLLNEDLSISQISFKVGFSSQAYFSTVFKSKFGLTPSEFKEKKKEIL